MVKRLVWDWTSNGSGAATLSVAFNGRIVRVTTDPGATAPTDDYDLTFVDEDGLDLFMGRGANRDTTNSEHFCPGMTISDGTNNNVIPVAYNGTATLTIANAGDTKQGTVTMFSVDE